MKINFKKITAIATGLIMVGMTAGIAAAANYPAPFVQSGSADVAIVYGSSAQASDVVQAGNIQSNLQSYMGASTGGSTSTATGSDQAQLWRSTDYINLGDNVRDVFATSVTKDQLKILLADGTYNDDQNNGYAYTQKIDLGVLPLQHFSDSDYKDKVPTVGIKLSDSYVMNYTLDFTTDVNFSAATMETTNLRLLGKDYYILDVQRGTTNKTVLLDSANSAIMSDTDTKTITIDSKTYTVTVGFITTGQVKLVVNGETTNTLAAGETYKLSDGTYLGVKDILVQNYAGGTKQVEFSLGKGKLELIDGNKVKVNDKTINELTAYLLRDSTNVYLDKIMIQWVTDGEKFIVPGTEVTMPAFGAVKFTMGDFVVSNKEVTKLDPNSDTIDLKTVIKDGAVTIPLAQVNSTGQWQLIGKDSSNRLVTSPYAFVFMNKTAGDKYMVASWNSTKEAETYYLAVDFTTNDNNVNAIKLTNVVTGEERTVTNVSTVSYGGVILTINAVTLSGSQKWANISINSGGSFNHLYTKEGMEVYLPYYAMAFTDAGPGAINYTNRTSGTAFVKSEFAGQGIYNGTIEKGVTTVNGSGGFDGFNMWFVEKDKDVNLGKGNTFNATLAKTTSNTQPHVSAVDMAEVNGPYVIGDTKVYEEMANSSLATKTLYDQSGNQYSVEIDYAGGQCYAPVYIASPDTVVSSTGTSTGATSLGDVLVLDSEVSSVSSKNLIVIGGSCVNAAAAKALGVAEGTCADGFTTATSVGAGQFLIKGVADAYTTGKLALVVAGYEAADTVNAVTYLKNNIVDTSKAYTGTSSTSATLQVA